MKFKKLFGRKKQHRRAPRANEFMLESLEPRLLLSATPMTAAVVTTDHVDYAPGETAVITTSNQAGDGAQFAAGELVRFQVSRTDGMADAASTTADVGPSGNGAWYVVDGVGGFTAHLGSDVSGDGVADWIAPDNDLTVNSSISTTWFVEEQYRNSSLLVTAAGQESGAIASQAFTDAATNTSTVLTATAATTVYGSRLDFTAIVQAAVGTVDPTGTVEFFVDGVSIGQDLVGSGGAADGIVTYKSNLLTFALTAGTHSVNAVFTSSNLASFNDSTSANISHTVTQKPITGRFIADVLGKIYDGTTVATGVATLANVELFDLGNVNLEGSANYATPDVGIKKAVTFTGGVLTGSAAGNYILDPAVRGDVQDVTPATVTVSNYTGVYDGLAHKATVVGAPGEDLSGSLIMATHTNVGIFTESWTFANANYIAASGTNTITITKANATIVTNGYNGVYDGAVHTATATATGVLGEPLSGLVLNATPHSNVGNYSDSWTFTDVTGNYNNVSGTVSSSIAKAVATVNVSGFSGIYDAAAHGATGTVTGVAGDLAAAGSSLALGASFTNAPGGTANWSFTGGTNYTDQSGSVAIAIAKAVATVSVSGFSGIYDAAAHGATGTVTGVAGDLAAAGSSLALGASFTNAPGGTANWSFTGGTNYTDQSGSVAIAIAKATAIVNVSGFSGTYDAAAHGATGTVTGVAGDLAAAGSSLALGASFTNAPGGTANWSFTGGTNYTDQSGSVAIAIAKAVATVNVSGFSGIYDAAAHGATIGGVIGAAGDLAASGSVLTLGGENFTNAPGGTATWSFNGGTNYTNQTGSVAIVINQATATLTGNALNGRGYLGVYDAQAHAATATVTGVGGVNLGTVASSTTATNAGVTTHTVTFLGDVNYKAASKVLTSTITQANVTLTGNALNGRGYLGVYDAQAHAVTATVTGVGGAILGTVASSTTATNAGVTTHTVTFLGDVNYKAASKVLTSTITQANVTLTGTGFHGRGYFGVYDAQAHAVTATVTGVGGVNLGTVASSTTATNAGVTTHTVTFLGDVNYRAASKVLTSTITQANVTLTGTGFHGRGYFGVYDAQAHAATATVTGVGGVNLGTVTSSTTATNAGVTTHTVTFLGDVNYRAASKVLTSTITQANVTLTGNALNGRGYLGVYDAQAHAVTATVTGVGGAILGTVASSTTATNAGVTTHTVTFLGDVNYKAASKVLTSTITQASVTITGNALNGRGYLGVFDGQPHAAMGTVTGVGGAILGTVTSSTTATNAGVTTHTVTFLGDVNYKAATKNLIITIL